MDKVKIKNPILIVLIFSIRIYQLFISPILGPKCRFFPSCSQYCLESLKKFGLLKGFYYSFIRLKKCHPFGSSGFDPVKKKIQFKEITLNEIIKFREESLYYNLPKKLSKYKEDKFKNTHHYAIFKDDKLVSGLTLIKGNSELKEKVFQIRGMFTVKDELRNGFGSMLIKNILIKLKENRMTMIWCNSRISAINFYRENKFIEIGETFKIPLIGLHKKLQRRV